MGIEDSRRRFLLNSFSGASLLLLGAGTSSVATVHEIARKLNRGSKTAFAGNLSFAEILAKSPVDKADLDPAYARISTFVNWHRLIQPLLDHYGEHLPANGKVVEMGVYRGQSFSRLLERHGIQRCLGFDIHPYTVLPGLQHRDVRTLTADDDIPISLGWNDIGEWHFSPRSRMAAFQFLKRNLVPGGILLDDALNRIPRDLDLSGLELVEVREHVTVFRKRSTSLNLFRV